MADKFTQRAQNALNYSLLAACELGHTYIGTEHLLLGLAQEKKSAASRMLEERRIQAKQLRDAIAGFAGTGVRTVLVPSDMTQKAKKIIESAYLAATQTPVGDIGTEHLLYAILEEKECVATKLLVSLGVNITELKNDILAFLGGGKRPESKTSPAKQEHPHLTQYGKDLTALAQNGHLDPVIGREEETARVIQILCRRTKNNPCLIGEPGVGKTAVIEGLAQRIVHGNVPDSLKNKTILALDLPAMIAGAKYRGEFEDRLKKVMEELSRNPSTIMFIDELHTIVGAGAAEGAVDAANILKPALARGEIQMIGATTLEEYRRHIEKDSALERRFQPILVEEPTREQSLSILEGLREKYEAHHKLTISDEALRAAIQLSSRYIRDRFLPDKAIDLIDEAAARVRISDSGTSPEKKAIEEELAVVEGEKELAIAEQKFELAAKLRDKEREMREALAELDKRQGELPHRTVTEEDVARIVTAWTGIPVSHLTGDETKSLQELESALGKRIIGQERAITAVSHAIQRARLGIKDPKRPIGSFLFLGPTGVGKTELTKALSGELYGREDALIRLNMSEYQEGFSTSKIIGSPPGYIGYDEGGQLTEQVHRRPYSVILFDEIEKAHPDIFRLLLQILDDGMLTDSQGRTVDFKNTVIILTSNLGAGVAHERPLGFGTSQNSDDEKRQINRRIFDEVKKAFPPEFLNRLDAIIYFEALEKSHLHHIASLLLEEAKSRLQQAEISLEVDDNVIDFLVERGYQPSYGARPLRRTITSYIEDEIASRMLLGEISRGDSLRVTAFNGTCHIEKLQEAIE
jgi:ATP-dependent Clp protease ATP-binding subunit ClpC